MPRSLLSTGIWPGNHSSCHPLPPPFLCPYSKQRRTSQTGHAGKWGWVQVQPSWGNVTITIAGLTNTYSSYVTTFEEYQAQRYEGASTIFGPHTLDAYIQVTPPFLPLQPPQAPLFSSPYFAACDDVAISGVL